MRQKDTNTMKKFLVGFFILSLILSCSQEVKINPEIAAIPVDVEVIRFDQEFALATQNDLPKLKKAYPYLFPKQYDNAYWNAKMKDTLQKEIEREVTKVFPETTDIKDDLDLLFKHAKFYFPSTSIPKVITVTSEVEYKNKVLLADTLLLLALDNYLGKDHYFYTDIVKYHSKNFRKEQIDVDVASAFAKANIPRPTSPTFLAEMVYQGKQLYVMELLLPQKAKSELFSYTQEEYDFAVENEVNIWQYFIANEHLFSTDRKLLARFVNPAPFSKFRLEFDNETPGRIARFTGYNIVKSFMNKNDVPLKNMLILDAETLFKQSKYKP